MGGRPHVLAAVPAPALLFLEKAVGSYVHLVPSRSYDDAVRQLADSDAISLVVCGVYFDHARMFDLLRWVKENRASLGFVCCRILDYEMPSVSVETLRIACLSLGAASIDLPRLERQYGVDGVESEFRARLLSALGTGPLDGQAQR